MILILKIILIKKCILLLMAEKANTRFFFMGCWNNDVPVKFKTVKKK